MIRLNAIGQDADLQGPETESPNMEVGHDPARGIRQTVLHRPTEDVRPLRPASRPATSGDGGMTWLGDAHETMRSPLMNRPHAKILLTAIVGLTVSACAVTPNPFTQGEFESRAKEDRQTLFSDQEPITAPLTLADTMARVLKYNLDRRAKMAEEALALGQLDLDRYALLPELTAKAGYAGRSEHLATNSKSVGSEAPPSEDYTYSADRDVITADLGLTWNVLDFGVSYFNAHQNADRALIMSERRRKAVANLAQEVRFSYWRAAAAQVMRDRVLETVAEAEQALRNAEKVEAEKLRDPFEVLRIQKALLESIRQLETIDSELGTREIQTRGIDELVPPGSDFRLAVSDTVDLHVPDWSSSRSSAWNRSRWPTIPTCASTTISRGSVSTISARRSSRSFRA